MIDPKAAAGTMGGALALLVWTILAAFVDAVHDLSPETLVTLTGATATVLTGLLAYFTPNLASKLLERGAAVLKQVPTGTNVEATTLMPDSGSDPHEGGTGAPAPAGGEVTAPPPGV